MQLVFIIFQKDLPLLCLFISEQNQKQRDYFMLVSPVLPNPSELLSVFSSLVTAVQSKYSKGIHRPPTELSWCVDPWSRVSKFDFSYFRSEEEANSIIMFGVLFGITAGIMTEVAIKSLLLEAARYDPEDRVVSKVC